MKIKMNREKWKGKYRNVARNIKGQFISWEKADYKHTLNKFKSRIDKKIMEKLKCFHVHAKLKMTKGWKGGTIEMEAYLYTSAMDSETAKDKLEQEINSRFSSGDSAFTEITNIKLFANEIPCSEMETEGKILWRDEYLKRRSKWKQETLTSY